MKRKLYNVIVFLFFVANVFAQKTDKKYQEKFYTNGNVEIEINASNADVEVQNWNKNEVLVEASIEVEGVTKEEAKKYIDKWRFEALGNKSKVKINANGSEYLGLGSYISFNQNTPKLAIGFAVNEKGETLKELENISKGMGTIFLEDFEEFSFPEIQSRVLFSNIDKLEFDFDKYAKEGDLYFFEWKDGAKKIKIKSKKEWEKFKKTKEYKKLKQELKEKRNKLSREEKKELLTLRKNVLQQKKEIEKQRKIAILKKRKKELELYKSARKELEKRLENTNERKRKKIENQIKMQNLAIGLLSSESDGKKVKIKKKIVIKVPKNTTFKLNTRHCKIKLPNTIASGKVSYGSFNADGLVGGNLNINSSPVDINTLTACTLFLNNVQTANVSSISNATLKSSSTDVSIDEILKNVTIDNSFGKLYVAKFNKNFEQANINLSQTDAYLTFGNNKPQFDIDISKKLKGSWNSDAMKVNKNSTKVFGNFTVKSQNKASDTFLLTAKYSKLTIN